MKKIRVLVIDDSALVRKILPKMLSYANDIEVVGTAADPFDAREKIKKLNPDVITLDIEMPKMDGLTFLKNLMRLRPLPVVMISTLTEKGAESTLQALELGAVDFISKPKLDIARSLADYSDEVITKVRGAAKAQIRTLADHGSAKNRVNHEPVKITNVDPDKHRLSSKKHLKIIAIGASTGGTEAIKNVVRDLPGDTPGIVVSQHLPLAFSESFAHHVDQVSEMKAQVARDGQQIYPGNVYIAPGDRHMLIVRDGARYICKMNDGEPVNRHKPSVDVMFRSVAENVGPNAISVLLTGMGADGAQGMKAMHDAGASTIIQDEPSSVVWGMPGEAYKLGCTDHVLPLNKVPAKMLAIMK